MKIRAKTPEGVSNKQFFVSISDESFNSMQFLRNNIDELIKVDYNDRTAIL